jgi:hypothetical protein
VRRGQLKGLGEPQLNHTTASQAKIPSRTTTLLRARD